MITDLTPARESDVYSTSDEDARGGLVSRAFVEPHVHPDKSYSLSDLPEGLEASVRSEEDSFARAAQIKAGFTADNVERRALRAFELAASNGVTKLRATADVDTLAGLRGLEGLLRARDRAEHLLDVEIVAFPQEGLSRDPGAAALLEQAIEMGADFIGGWPNVEATRQAQEDHVRTVFDLAQRFDVGVDIHADCFLDTDEQMLEFIADETLRRGFPGRVLASHCVALELYDDATAARVIEKVAAAGITVAVIPLNLADGGPRGLSRPQELLAAGVNVVAGSDNMNDGWYPLGTLNPLDRANMTFFGGSFDGEGDVDTVWDMISGAAWQALGDPAGELRPGLPAELVILDAPTRAAALERPLGGLVTVHRGRVVARRAVRTTWGAAVTNEGSHS
nr:MULTISPECIES: amidohydrolase family protein [unclassified Leucobacter]